MRIRREVIEQVYNKMKGVGEWISTKFNLDKNGWIEL